MGDEGKAWQSQVLLLERDTSGRVGTVRHSTITPFLLQRGGSQENLVQFGDRQAVISEHCATQSRKYTECYKVKAYFKRPVAIRVPGATFD